MLKKFRVNYLLMACLFAFTTLFGVFYLSTNTLAFTDVSSMTDQNFFGVWNGSSWTTVGKINYSYSANLSSVETYVKAGDYTNAKSDLLTYYKNRTTPTVVAYDPNIDRNTGVADLTADDIMSGVYGETYLTKCTFTNTASTVSAVVTSGVTEAMSENKQISFMLITNKKGDYPVAINSDENASNKPVLEVVVSGQTQTLYPVKDTYIRPGTYGNTNYGTATTMTVKDAGTPFDDYTCRAFLQFDLSGLSGTPTSATLKLYGYNTAGTGNIDVTVFKWGNTNFGETSLTWNTTLGNTFSWQGVAGGTDWNQPASGASADYQRYITRFNFAKFMALEYNLTSTESYASNLIRLILDFITDKGNSTPGFPRTLEAGTRAYNLTRAYHYVKGSTSMDGPGNTAILKYLWTLGDFLSQSANFISTNNWGAFQTQGLYNISVYFPEFSVSSSWESTAVSRLDTLATNFNFNDGSYIEASSYYTVGSMATFTNCKILGNLNNRTFTSSFDTKLQVLGKYVADFSFPNGYDPQYGDADYRSNRVSVKDIGDIYNHSNLKYFGSGGIEGTVPSYTSVLYPTGKTAFMRSGWGENDLYMNVDLNDGSHRHPDLLNVTAYAYGKRLIVDPGRFEYTDTTEANWLRLSTEAHNTIEINDTPQANTSPTSVTSWATNGYFDFYEGYSDGYSDGNNFFRHNRDVLFIKPNYWIVSDYVDSPSGTNKYQQTWHMLPDASISIDGTTKRTKTAFSSSPNIQVVPADPNGLTASVDSGYYSEKVANVTSANYASYVKTVSGDITFDTVLFPTTQSDTTRDVRVTRLTTNPSVATTVATALKVELNFGNNGDVGYYYLSHESSPVTARDFDVYNYNGKMAYVQKDPNSILKSAAVKSGKTLKQSGSNLINSPSTVEDIGVVWNGTTLDIYGSKLKLDTNTGTAVAIYAPSATTVKLNGSSVSYTRSGDYIYAVGVNTTAGTFNPANDSFIRGGTYADTNYGTIAEMSIKTNSDPNFVRKAYLLFDVSGFTGGTTPKAKLRLNVSSVGTETSRTIKIYGTTETWSEGTITWNNAPAGSTYITSFDVSNTAGVWYEPDVTTYVNNNIGDKKVSFLLVNEGVSSSNNQVAFYSDEGTNRPQLVIDMNTVAVGPFNPTNDSHVRGGSYADTNYGTNIGMSVKVDTNPSSNMKAYLLFDFGGFTGGTTSLAKLRLKASSVGTDVSRTIKIYGTTETWSEGTITWNNAPAGSTYITSIDVSDMPQVMYEVDVTNYVNNNMDDKKVSFLLVNEGTPTTENLVTFYSKEKEGHKPELVINNVLN